MRLTEPDVALVQQDFGCDGPSGKSPSSDRGCSAPVFPAPAIFEEAYEDANIVQKHVARTRTCFHVIASVGEQSIAPRGLDGLLRCARNDVARALRRDCSRFVGWAEHSDTHRHMHWRAPPILRHYTAPRISPLPPQPFNFAIQAMLTFKFLKSRRRSMVRSNHPGNRRGN
jgi:hypothetical protein